MKNIQFKAFCDGAGGYHIFTYNKEGKPVSAYHVIGTNRYIGTLLKDVIEFGDRPDNCGDSDFEGIPKEALLNDNEFLDDVESEIIADNDGIYVNDWNYRDLGVSNEYVDNTLPLDTYISLLSQRY